MRKTIITLAALVAGAGSALALDDPGRALVASDTLRIAYNPAVTGDPGISVRQSFIPPYTGTVRIKWQIKSSSGMSVGASADVHAISSCGNSTTSTTFVTQTCDLRVVGGYPVTVTGNTNDGGTSVTIRHVQMFYNVIDFDGKAIRYEVLTN
jgi:hypothetical protein